MVRPSGRKRRSDPLSVNLVSSTEIANAVRAIIDTRVLIGISAIGSGICGNAGKLSPDIPAIRVRDRPLVILAQWFSRNFIVTSPSGNNRTKSRSLRAGTVPAPAFLTRAGQEH